MPSASRLACVVAIVATLLVRTPSPAGAHDDGCARWAPEARRTGSVPAVLDELSGIAASRRHPGIYWAHNDSSNAGALFALDESGRVRARFTLRGLRPRDIEDVAVGPCAKGDPRSCIYLADTGDNLRRRREVWIARAVEPATLDGGVLDVDARSFRYPDGAHDAEGLVVDPRSAALYVVTKSLDGLGEVYRLDGLGTRGGGRAVPIVTLPAPVTLARFTTAADAHPDGERILLRTYTAAWELVRPGARSLEEVFRARPVEVTAPSQRQGEGIAYTRDGRAYVLAGEGAGSAIYRVSCASGDPPAGAGSAAPAGSDAGARRSVNG